MKQTASNSEGYKVGDYLYSTWGYEQTNVDFYKVVGVTAKCVKMVAIGSKIVKQDSAMSGFVVPVDDSTEDNEVLLRRVNKWGSVRIDSYTNASAWDGKPVLATWWY